MSAAAAGIQRESDLAERWAAGARAPLRLEDGRALRVIFPGVPGGGAGPDFRGAILDAGGDILRGDVELHLLASGFRSHGHVSDPAYGGVVLHVVTKNDVSSTATVHASGRAIPVLVLGGPAIAAGESFTPPCVFGVLGRDVPATLARMGERRLRAKAARVEPFVAAGGAGQALYTLILEQLAGSANRAAFGSVARTLPLASLIERLDAGPVAPRAFLATAELKGVAAPLALRRAGLRPMAGPARRLEAAGSLVSTLWPRGSAAKWPDAFFPLPGSAALLRILNLEGVGRSSAIELAVNAILPVGLAAGVLEECEAMAALAGLPSPGTYGKLKSLERWLGPGPFKGAIQLQGGLALHADYCTRGRCGRCPFSTD